MIRILLICLFSLVSSPGLLLARDVVFYHTDNVGTPVAMTNSAGAVVWRAHEKPFGEEFQTTETPEHNSRRFIGKEKDKETGLVYIGARYLDPETGRFLQPDPVGPVDSMTGKVNVEMLMNPQRLNRYVYGLNNPYRYIDPDGESPVLVLGLIGAAASYLSAPDVANAPADASTPTYKSNGGYSIVAGAAGGVGAGKVAQVFTATKMAEESPIITNRITRGGDEAIRIEYPDGRIKDISPKRVKEYEPNNHPNSPPGIKQKVKFDNALPGSKGYKRAPTTNELKQLKHK
ncbi:MAG: RHS repeat-associated core domain-containing protein [Pseudomonadota bacterium]